MHDFHGDEDSVSSLLFDQSMEHVCSSNDFEWDIGLGFAGAEFNAPENEDVGALGAAHVSSFEPTGIVRQSALSYQEYTSIFLSGPGTDPCPSSTLDGLSIDDLWPELFGIPGSTELQPRGPISDPSHSPSQPGGSPPAQVYQQSTEEETDTAARKRRRTIPPIAKRLLEECFQKHRADPYIPQHEIGELVVQTGLTPRQVRTFFANSRARKLPRTTTSASPKRIIDATRSRNKQQATPMDRFLSSSPEDEGISEAAVRQAATTIQSPTPASDEWQTWRESAPSTVSSSAPSSTSNSSAASTESTHPLGARRGRKRQRDPTRKAILSIIRRPSSPSRKFQCTFCTLDFAQKYDWRRHEESVHFPQKEWVCMPDGPTPASCCVFCGERNPDERHLEAHKSIGCSRAPRSQRAFLRKDKLVQHIRQVHSSEAPKVIKEWCRSVERSVELICGMCAVFLPDWQTRVDHIASHFTSDITMQTWLFERPGGVVPQVMTNDTARRRAFAVRFSPSTEPDGAHACDMCSERFSATSNAIIHRRRVHNTYLPSDKQTISAAGGFLFPHKSQDLLHVTHQTSRIELSRGAPFAGNLRRAAPRSTTPPPPQGGQAGRGDRANEAGANAVPVNTWRPSMPAMFPFSGFPTQRPSARGLPPHRTSVPNPNPKANSNPPQIPHPPKPPLTFPPSPASLPQPVDMTDVVRTVTRRMRTNARKTNYPALGMFHSLEQMAESDTPWPSPYDAPDRGLG